MRIEQPRPDTRSVRDKINDGIYKNTWVYPQSFDARKIWKARSGALEGLFMVDALEEVGLSGHPKAMEAYEFAHDHSGTMLDTLLRLERIARLIK